MENYDGKLILIEYEDGETLLCKSHGDILDAVDLSSLSFHEKPIDAEETIEVAKNVTVIQFD